MTLWIVAHQAFLSITNSWSLLKLMPIELVMPSNHLLLCCPLLLLPSIFLSIRVFSNESILHIRWPKYCSFSSVSVLPMNIPDWFPSGWTDWIYLQSKGLSRVFSNTTVKSISSLVLSFSFVHKYSQTRKNYGPSSGTRTSPLITDVRLAQTWVRNSSFSCTW